MKIQHNIPAMNSYRNYTNNVKAVAKNLEKLSSGYRINRAGDDAAGLAISEKMRAQVTGLATAQKNAKDGISLIQTAEGALTEVHSMLNRMFELAEQSANGVYDNEVDRANLQKEFDALRSEIDRVADSSNFNGQKLLDGSLSTKGGSSSVSGMKFENATIVKTTAATGVYKSAAVEDPTAKLATIGDKVEVSFGYKANADGKGQNATIGVTLGTDDKGNKILIGDSGKEYKLATPGTVAEADIQAALDAEMKESKLSDLFDVTGGAAGGYIFTAKEEGSAGAVITSNGTQTTTSGVTDILEMAEVTVTTAAADVHPTLTAAGVKAYTGANAEDAIFTINGNKFVLAAANQDVSGLDKNVTVLTGTAFTADHASVIAQKTGLSVSGTATLTFKAGNGTNGSGGLTLQIGDTSDSYNMLTVSVSDMHCKALGIASGSISIAEQGDSQSAMDAIKNAINMVSSTRGDLGALQNRLDHTINNLSVMEENIQDAEAAIRDTDVAKEMMAYTKNNILVQSAQAMLAQANQLPQGVLQLLG